jgi:hypothetical protein
MHIVIETITPKVAEAWLNANKSNRKLRDGIVEKYANDMKRGGWTNCPEPISFYADGDLADGQHRLWAIVESGTSQTFPVARGLSREDGLNLNTGAVRNVIDNARISKTDANLSPSLISAARAIEHGTVSIGRVLSNSEILAMVERQREAAAFAASTVKRKQLLCGAVVLGAVGRAYLHEPDTDRLRRFCDVLATGFYEGDGETAAVTLRNYLLSKGATASSSALWKDTFLKCQNATFYFMRSKKLMNIKAVSDEAYPLAKVKAARATRMGKAAAAQKREAIQS